MTKTLSKKEKEMTNLDALKEAIRIAEPGEYVLPTTDQKGDGNDIACAKHVDDFDELKIVAMERGALLTRIYASGWLCGYLLRVPEPDVVFCLAQHSGCWGPWYHISAYRRLPGGKFKHAYHVGGHYSRRRLPAALRFVSDEREEWRARSQAV